MLLEDLKIIKYELFFDETRLNSIYLERVRGIDCERWAIRTNGAALGKISDPHGYFCFALEPLPSSRDDEYYKEYRWETKEEAFEFWTKNLSKIITKTG